jgi:CRISPR-associated endonuclease/helicase Cas3/CRISPR-associated endonuclease Cas3-HD
MYHAHSTDNPDKTDWQILKDHLQNVADIASAFAQDFRAREFAYAAGLLHDLGKYSQEFQKRLEGASIRVDHSTAGAREARLFYPPAQSRILEYIITGHHGGLQNYGSSESGLQERLEKALLPDYSVYRKELSLPDIGRIRPAIQPLKNRPGFSLAFYIRMLYSCLIDADSLDTEAFIDPGISAFRGRYESFDILSAKFQAHMDALLRGSDDSTINRYRTEIYEQCREKSQLPPQMYTLTVPTGGGKTLSSMAFALEHLKRNNLKRIFYVIPYTSIIEQNADVFRRIFGAANILEHHSNYDPKTPGTDASEDTDTLLELSSENWDIPLVVTTNVQFFESLFSHKRSRCRRIHNLAKSVIILDEAQMIPVGFLKPCLAALSELVRNYGCSVVICTATQPKLSGLLDEAIKPIEMINSPRELYEVFRRVQVSNIGTLDDQELAGRLKEHNQVLCIVNTRTHARNLYGSLSGLDCCYHLSARMCPVHRRVHLAEITDRLQRNAECRVISTQLIEAGVDIDFPVVYRAHTGVDSIAQAAGRCNREGKMDSGDVYIFKSTEMYGKAGSWQQRTAEIGEMVIKGTDDPLALTAVDDYFQRLYFYEGESGLDKKGILPACEERARELAFPFEDISTAFRLIEEGTSDIIIPYDRNAESLIQELKHGMVSWKAARKLQGYTVSVYPHEFRSLENARAIDIIGERYYVLNDVSSLYSEKTGLVASPDEATGALLII